MLQLHLECCLKHLGTLLKLMTKKRTETQLLSGLFVQETAQKDILF